MDIRYEVSPKDVKRYTTEELRESFLVESLFKEGEISFTYSHYDRLVIGGAIPTKEELTLDAGDTLRTEHFLERREIAIIHIGGGKGKVKVNGESYKLEKRDCLYVGKGNEQVTLHSDSSADPARFYLVSATAHKNYPTRLLPIAEAEPTHLGSDAESNNRTIYKYVHEDGIQSCQLMVGMTLLEPNNMWNTMPAHVHDRRMEAYLYFDMEPASRVFHFMGQPNETRHMLIENEQAVISPPWSIHSGVGTSNYTFIWAMAGENYTFKDMDFVPVEELK
ncbi:5-keto-4-deoxyuronate isomerase [Alkalihalobacillus alcalophilus ATCC 27647 = CGMCC 1.3604]|uniref:4-deoxy-L-threo-5-hexosulose-uronate ketol-isomerase n=1 Tax=Alkalihalobacillus alcalophilus ATCC 27647 = CGMCC 1.3604 TaxID=1218173 RepID=A0A094XF98_ALKAL|nr:5-dehydro-4-deoxy-D-glucuronate isomerase [Alkalihalobacillus alcalophilus]KGA97450.1 5-keto-4-deoxyuronate isomerase [Alkalihalobacillus alcalophilus ATCC 27647 = CGMCC 1.3604]MED1562230.1 5-dehydro-4-deoxy-D-glucuronate isomerase [Alkalihalobacillus alcalophilus]THG89974.1 5-keto-4-deoxyuronate isomerase [Alkalihalobacillus alcalophilus ATCC 27647 = CGMCC 1.3604]